MSIRLNDEDMDIESQFKVIPGDKIVIKFIQPITVKPSEIIFDGELIPND